MKIKNEAIRKQKIRRFSKDRWFVMLLLVFVVAVVVINQLSSRALRETVDILKFSENIPQEGVVREEVFKKDTMMRSEFMREGTVTLSDGSKRRAIVLWDEREQLKGTFASHYIRKNTPVYWDSLTKEVPRRHAYLYKMEGELLKVDIPASQFGEMLVVGDKINVRASYTEQVYTLPTFEEFQMAQQLGLQTQTTVERLKLIFAGATVMDVLNSEGESIFNIYYQLLNLSKSDQQLKLADKEFMKRLAPSAILLSATPEEADAYTKIVSKNPTLIWTLLPRTGGSTILDAINDLHLENSKGEK